MLFLSEEKWRMRGKLDTKTIFNIRRIDSWPPPILPLFILHPTPFTFLFCYFIHSSFSLFLQSTQVYHLLHTLKVPLLSSLLLLPVFQIFVHVVGPPFPSRRKLARRYWWYIYMPCIAPASDSFFILFYSYLNFAPSTHHPTSPFRYYSLNLRVESNSIFCTVIRSTSGI